MVEDTLDEPEPILDVLGLDTDVRRLFSTPESKFRLRLLHAVLDARRDGLDYWRISELLEEHQRATIQSAFEDGEFGADSSRANPATVQYAQVVHATVQALQSGAPEKQVMFNLVGAYHLFENDKEQTRP